MDMKTWMEWEKAINISLSEKKCFFRPIIVAGQWFLMTLLILCWMSSFLKKITAQLCPNSFVNSSNFPWWTDELILILEASSHERNKTVFPAPVLWESFEIFLDNYKEESLLDLLSIFKVPRGWTPMDFDDPLTFYLVPAAGVTLLFRHFCLSTSEKWHSHSWSSEDEF